MGPEKDPKREKVLVRMSGMKNGFAKVYMEDHLKAVVRGPEPAQAAQNLYILLELSGVKNVRFFKA